MKLTAAQSGGFIVAEILNHKKDVLESVRSHAAVRSSEQAHNLSKLDINPAQLDLSDQVAVTEYILSNDISNLIAALENQKDTTGKETFFIHRTGPSAFDQNTNRPFGEFKDTDHVYDLERKSADTYIVRQVDNFAIENLKSTGVSGLLVFPPTLRKSSPP
ncbi:uncharacterized protein N7469_010447 [Penicillium citrinum]|uniref:Uncharacterized protein n=1 Tax=Penicillium citrinum TaxID=5077 RepID=A0A9W9NKC9_PENCI|nr:uncharacterized protein N7469_010447 [Penicillium citrinum]KAJ5221560.1 hypothetical protein N7469_010447 [Penicillium citrinum]